MEPAHFPPLTKNSIVRTLQHARRNEFAILTSWKKQLPTAENRANLARLRQHLRSLRYGFFPVRGVWKSRDTGEIEHEPSLFVPGMTAEHAKAVGAKFGHKAVLHGTPESVKLYFPESGKVFDLGEFDADKLANDYSVVRSGSFSFVRFEEVPGSFIEALAHRQKTASEGEA